MLVAVLAFAALLLVAESASAGERKRKGKATASKESPLDTVRKAQHKIDFQAAKSDSLEFVFPKDAPYLSEADERLYYLRSVNIHGAKHINHDMIRSSSGLVPGDSIYLPSSFIQNAMNRLWSQRYFADIQVGAVIEGDNVDLEVTLVERPRVMNWAIVGVPKSKSKDLMEELKLKRGHELSEHVIDRNTKLIKKHFADKGFLDCEVEVKIDLLVIAWIAWIAWMVEV